MAANNIRVQIDEELCNKCRLCEKDCPAHAISIDTMSINSACILCAHCVAICKQEAVRIDNIKPQPIEPQTITPQELKTLFTHTRSCRHFKLKNIDQHILDDILQSSHLYPSASNTRKLQITIITDEKLIETIQHTAAKKLLSTFRFYTNPIIAKIASIIVPKQEMEKLTNYKKTFTEELHNKSHNITYKAPAVLLFHGKPQITGMIENDANIWATYTSLLCSSYGLGTCFNGFIVKGLKGNKKILSQLGIPKNHSIFISLLVGYPKHTYYNSPLPRNRY